MSAESTNLATLCPMDALGRKLLDAWKANGRRWEDALREWDTEGIEVFNPALYAADLYERFLERYAPARNPVFTLGLNPGPYGMAQTGIPFTDCRTAAAILEIDLPLPGRAPAELVKRLRRENGSWRGTYERSSLGIYRALKLAWGDVGRAYRNWYVVNACPLLFLKASDYKNMTPADGPLKKLAGFQELRVAALKAVAEILEPRAVVCLGKDVSGALGPDSEAIVGKERVIHYPHPARAVPDAWAAGLAKELKRLGLAAIAAIALSSSASAQHEHHRMNHGAAHAREASGTSWQPDDTPMAGWHGSAGDWSLMGHGVFFGVYDHQGGPRGASLWHGIDWGMLMASRPLAGGTLKLRAMATLEPWSVGREGYPLLLQSGEAVDGRPLHDRQHPHDAFMELAASYERPLASGLKWHVYGGPVGEPALGPTAFPHRASAASDPAAPLGHHWQDSSHIAFGVVTAGLSDENRRLEASWFNGREPDDNRANFDFYRMDSFSVRASMNPDSASSYQVSYGHMESPEILDPHESLHRLTASASRWSSGLATTFAIGWNLHSHGPASPSALVEADWSVDRANVLFGRVEAIAKGGHDLDVSDPRPFAVGSLSGGYRRVLGDFKGVEFSLGGRGSLGWIENGLRADYGTRAPWGVMAFIRLAPAP
ncbi:MAG: hypothetical protein HY925_02690 [Elusimicrobia bacterium]|nr:hypothetical protein [Elusimicrobiota bacterium]